VARPSSLFFVVIPFALIFWGRSCAYATDLLGMVVVSRCLYYCYSEVAGRDVLIVPPVLSRLGLFAVHLKLHEVLELEVPLELGLVAAVYLGWPVWYWTPLGIS